MRHESVQTLVGETLDGTYLIERLLNKGSMGEVYVARNLRTDGRFAVKVLMRESCADQELYTRFRNEARVTSVLRHPGIVQVIDFAELPDGRPYMVMEFLDGEDLHARLRRVGKMQLPEALRICRQVATALHVAHRADVVHRDLKPGNIILVRQDLGDEYSEQAKVIDFGLSRIRGALAGKDVTLDSQILGTPQYMSPEAAQALNSKLDGRSDQFSLAVILYLMLSGRSPFAGRNFVETLGNVIRKEPAPLLSLRPDLPQHVAEAVHRALSKCKIERFPTIIDFIRAVEGLPTLPRTAEGDIHDTVLDTGLPGGLTGLPGWPAGLSPYKAAPALDADADDPDHAPSIQIDRPRSAAPFIDGRRSASLRAIESRPESPARRARVTLSDQRTARAAAIVAGVLLLLLG